MGEQAVETQDGKVVLEIDLAGLWVGGENGTFADYVAQMAADRLLEKEAKAGSEFRRRVSEITDGEIRYQLRPLIAEALERSVQPTDGFGTARGPATTLHETIVQLARKELTEKRGDSYRAAKTTIVEDFVRKEVQEALGKELQAVVREAKEEVLVAVRARAGEIIAETIERVATGRPI